MRYTIPVSAATKRHWCLYSSLHRLETNCPSKSTFQRSTLLPSSMSVDHYGSTNFDEANCRVTRVLTKNRVITSCMKH